MKRILTIQDISCVGKCSLTVALPIISAFKVETSVIPTAVLSTHTAFSGFTFRDLTDDLVDIKNHFIDQKFVFDGLYTGYLGSIHQMDIVKDYIKVFKNDSNFVLVDPVMGDNGKLYTGFDNEYASKMATLCSYADVIVPNITEACFMLNKPYIQSGYSEEYIKDLLVSLTDLGCKCAVLTGVSFDDNLLGVYGFDKENNQFFSYYRERLPKSFHGTGDVFASTLCGALTKDLSLLEALKIAVDYTVKCIDITISNPKHNWYGVEFENALPYLIERVNKI